MILVCESCKTRYLLAASALMPDGRRVRCTSCGHEWFQEPEEDDVDEAAGDEEAPEILEDITEGEEDDLEPIPESVKPDPDADEAFTVPAMAHDEAAPVAKEPGRIPGYAAAACVFFVLLGGFLLARESMVKVWPASYALYDLAGMAPAVDGEGLIFDGLGAEAKVNENGVSMLNLSGDVLNLDSQESPVPRIQATLIDEQGEVLDSWLVEAPVATLDSNSEESFATAYPGVPTTAKEVNVKFLPAGVSATTPGSMTQMSDTDSSESDVDESAP